jgi:hypothetical protein
MLITQQLLNLKNVNSNYFLSCLNGDKDINNFLNFRYIQNYKTSQK